MSKNNEVIKSIKKLVSQKFYVFFYVYIIILDILNNMDFNISTAPFEQSMNFAKEEQRMLCVLISFIKTISKDVFDFPELEDVKKNDEQYRKLYKNFQLECHLAEENLKATNDSINRFVETWQKGSKDGKDYKNTIKNDLESILRNISNATTIFDDFAKIYYEVLHSRKFLIADIKYKLVNIRTAERKAILGTSKKHLYSFICVLVVAAYAGGKCFLFTLLQ